MLQNNYNLKVTPIDNGTGRWGSNLCEIFIGDEKIGEFTRHYPSFTKETFKPFHWKGQDYAFYSADYSRLQVMTLPDCKEVELDEESGKALYGYCPVEVRVLRYWVATEGFTEPTPIDVDEDDENDEEGIIRNNIPTFYHDFALVSGCYWGDDSMMNVNIIDLRKLAEGKLNYLKTDDGRNLYQGICNTVSLKEVDVCVDELGDPETWEGRCASIIIPSPCIVRFKKGGGLSKKYW